MLYSTAADDCQGGDAVANMSVVTGGRDTVPDFNQAACHILRRASILINQLTGPILRNGVGHLARVDHTLGGLHHRGSIKNNHHSRSVGMIGCES